MEYLLYFILGISGFTYLVFLRFFKPQNRPPLPPGSMGWPLIGETLDLLRGNRAGKPDEFFNTRRRKYNNNIFKTSVIGEKTIILFGAAGNKFLFTSEKTLVLTWWPDSLKKLFGTSFFTAPYDEAIQTRKMVMTFLQTEVMHQMVKRFDRTCKKCLQRDWTGKSKVMAFSLIKNYAFSLACDMFTSVNNFEWETMMLKEFNILLKGVYEFPVYFPGTRHYNAVNSANFIRRELIKVIEGKRSVRDSEGSVEKDLVSYLIDARDEKGNLLSDVEIADNVILLMDSGHDTSSAAMMMLMKYLAESPHCYQQVLKEQKEIAMQKEPGELLNKDDIQKMKYSWNLWWNAANTHRSADYFPNPDKFDPMRFDRDTLTPYAYVPFGGGPRMCPGQEFAKVELLVFLHNIVCNFKWELEFPDELIFVDPMPTPSKGLPVYLYPLS
ncbi:beta-amyrin 28-monooxygenase [Ranunculus cassubicifolius]